MIFYINGKFTAQHTTGVQRVAMSLCRALDAHLRLADLRGCDRWVLLCPPSQALPVFEHIEVRAIGSPRWPLSAWEQLSLPLHARHGVLVNLAGSAPIIARDHVCMIHDAAVYDRPQAYTPLFRIWYRLLFRRLSRSAVLLLTASAFSRQRLSERLGVPLERIQVQPCGGDHLESVVSDPALIVEHRLKHERFLLAVGSANPNKNQAAMEQAFHRLPAAKGAKLVIVGGFNRRVFSMPGETVPGGDSRILRLGPVSDAHLKALYEHAAGLVFPSLYEGFGLPPLEAMACGCVVAASRSASIPEVCCDAVIYFDPLSIDEMTNAMQRLLDDEPLRERLRANGTAHWRQFRWERSAAWLQQQLTAARYSARANAAVSESRT